MPRWLAAVVVFALAGPAAAQSQTARLYGRVLDGPTGSPIPGAVVRAADAIAVTDPTGAWELTIPPGPYVLEVHAVLPDGSEEHLAEPDLVAVADSADERIIHIVTGAYLDGLPPRPDGIGVPYSRPRLAPEGEPIDLLDLWWERRHPNGPTLDDLSRLEIPDVLPETLRILRAYECRSGCGGTGGCPIDEVDFDDYAAGVVTSEIGVFRALTTGEATQLEGFKTFAVAARSYALWFWASDPDAAYHLDDTACNQRYTDGPYPAIINRANQETAGQILIQAGSEATIDKFEYAASCGRCGSQPEYQDALVPDDTGAEACTSGGWCGHNDCAAHSDNPNCPLESASVRCLVRGICQWGAAERSASGHSYTEILAHYQPNLAILDVDAPPITRLLGFVRAESAATGAGVAGASVGLDTGESTTTNGDGLFVFEAVEPGTRLLSVRADGYAPIDDTVEVVADIDTFHNVALTPVAGPEPEPQVEVNPEPVPDAGEDLSSQEPDLPEELGGPDAPEAAATVGRFGVVPEGGLEGGCGCSTGLPLSPAPLGVVLVWLSSRRVARNIRGLRRDTRGSTPGAPGH